MKKHSKTIFAGLLIIVAFTYLITIGLKEGSMYYLEVSEFVERMDSVANEKIRINGAVLPDTIHYDTNKGELTFTLKDTEGPQEINVIYQGAPPDLVDREGVTIVAEGIYKPAEKLFFSSNLLVKCPSKYEKKGDSA
jgi:cytochrome c-type biogenesis protein CcmE